MRLCEFFAFFALSIAACGKIDHKSSLQISRGTLLSPKDPNPIPGVLKISSPCPDERGNIQLTNCSATAVSDTTVLTSAHCFWNYKNLTDRSVTTKKTSRVVSEFARNAQPLAIHAPEDWILNPRIEIKPNEFISRTENDVAVLVFSPNTFKHYFEVTPSLPYGSEEFLMIGYSDVDLTPQEIAVNGKRWGQGGVTGFWPEKQIIASSTDSLAHNYIQIGDSGGPFISKSDCKIKGIAAAFGEEIKNQHGFVITQAYSVYASIEFNKTWLYKLKDKGAYICGLHGSEPTHCAEKFKAVPVLAANSEFPCDQNK